MRTATGLRCPWRCVCPTRSSDLTRSPRRRCLRPRRPSGVPPKVAVRAIREVVSRTLGEFDGLYAVHYPQEPRLLEQMRQQGKEGALPLPPEEKGAPLPVAPALEERAPPQERAQQLKILRVLRHMVLPEMVKRLMGD